MKSFSFNTRKVHKKGTLVMLAVFMGLSPLLQSPQVASANSTPYFPLIGSAYFSDDFLGRRANGPHHATDIFAAKMTPIISPVPGEIFYVNSPQATWGYSVGVEDASGIRYYFVHMNNDTPGTDDGRGGEMNAYAPDMKVGNKVEKGQLLGYVGDSGNAENTPPHLHFEIYDTNENPINPYHHLIRWGHVSTPSLYPPLEDEVLPFWVTYTGGLNVAKGDLNGDGNSETVVVGGPGGPPIVKAYDGNDSLLGEFAAYDPGFRGGGDIALGDMDGDNKDEFIVVPGPGGGPWVRIFNTNAQLLGQFAAYDPGFLGGLKVSAGDIDGDGTDEIITGPGAGGGPWVRVFNAFGQTVREFAAYDPGFLGGIDVATADTTGTTAKEIITGPGAGGGPWLKIFNADGTQDKEFPVYDQGYTGGIRVSGGNVRSNSTKDELMTIPAAYGESRVRLMANTGANLTDYPYLEKWWKGYYDVAAGKGSSKVVAGENRRGSMRDGAD